jgi:hypothetical protein
MCHCTSAEVKGSVLVHVQLRSTAMIAISASMSAAVDLQCISA